MTRLEHEILQAAVTFARTSNEMPHSLYNRRRSHLRSLVDSYVKALSSTKAPDLQETDDTALVPSPA